MCCSCPNSNEWTLEAVSGSTVPATGGGVGLTSATVRTRQYKAVPTLTLPTMGRASGTFTFQITNTGNIPLVYQYNTNVGYLPLAVGATATYPQSFTTQPCGTTPSYVLNKVQTKMTGCNGGNAVTWNFEIKLIGASNSHTLSAANSSVAVDWILGLPGSGCTYP